jgi:methylenetetrahydrofolate dehydrogenase (NADP+)/methenyltetrahydrofolate cyclohydrolase
MRSDVFLMPMETQEDAIVDKIQELNEDDRVHGILLQLPLPNSINSSRVISSIAPHKDVDGLHPQNLGYLMAGTPKLVPCTPLGCLHLIQSVMPDISGKHAVVVGRSVLVGRPTSLLLSFKDATVVQAHSHTTNLADECRRADILVSAVGKPDLITANHVKPGAIVVDVGITHVIQPDGKSALKGDVAFDEVRQVAGFLSPVPGGVGPMTVAYLLKNTLKAAENSYNN